MCLHSRLEHGQEASSKSLTQGCSAPKCPVDYLCEGLVPLSSSSELALIAASENLQIARAQGCTVEHSQTRQRGLKTFLSAYRRGIQYRGCRTATPSAGACLALALSLHLWAHSWQDSRTSCLAGCVAEVMQIICSLLS